MRLIPFRFLFILIFLSISSINTRAQSTIIIKGKLIDRDSNTLQMKNLGLLRYDGKSDQLIKESTTNSKGDFIFYVPPQDLSIGTFRLLILDTDLKKKKVYTDFQITDSLSDQQLGTVIATDSAIQLDDIKVFAASPIYIRKLDKLVFNVEGSILASGNSLRETLSKLPGIKIDLNDNISVNGKQGVLITIDGKGQYVTTEQIQVLLSTIKSESIKKLEIISNPSSKYDANQGSVINIITKKNNSLSDINLSYGTAIFPIGNIAGFSYPSLNLGTNYNYKAGKFSSNISLKLTDDHQFRNYTVEKDSFYSIRTIKQDTSKSIYNERKIDTHIGISYDINKSSFLSADFLLVKDFKKEYQNTDRINFFGVHPTADSSIYSKGEFDLNNFYTYSLTLQYSLDIDSVRNKHLDIYYDLSNFQMPSNNDVSFLLYRGTDLPQKTTFKSIPRFDVLYNSLKFDYKQDVAKGTQLFVGLKYSDILSDHSVNASNTSASNTLSQLSIGKFSYDELIFGGYLMLAKKAGIFEGQIGLRSEYTSSNAFLNSGRKIDYRRYNNIFPSLSLMATFDKNNKATFSYNKRIIRVGLNSLDPNLNYTSPFVLTKGDPKLLPQFINYFEFDYQYKELNFSITYSNNKNSGTDIPVLTSSASSITNLFQNVKNIGTTEFDSEYPVSITNWWSTINDITLANTLSHLQTGNLSYWSYNISSNQHFIINKGLNVDLSIVYNSKFRGYYAVYNGICMVNLGLRKSFLSRKFDLSINCNDVMGSNKFTITSSYPTQGSNFASIKNNRYLNVILKYNFKSGRAFSSKGNSSRGEFGEKRI